MLTWFYLRSINTKFVGKGHAPDLWLSHIILLCAVPGAVSGYLYLTPLETRVSWKWAFSSKSQNPQKFWVLNPRKIKIQVLVGAYRGYVIRYLYRCTVNLTVDWEDQGRGASFYYCY